MIPVDENGLACAPGDLRLVQEFCNSLHVDRDVDDWETRALFGDWLAAHGHARDVSARQYERARAVRTALRELIAANGRGHVPREGAATINEVIRELWLRPEVAEDATPTFTASTETGDALTAEVLAGVVDSLYRGTWTRMKVCSNDDCGWVFYDYSRSRTGRWCSMRMCGAARNARAYRNRRRAAQAA